MTLPRWNTTCALWHAGGAELVGVPAVTPIAQRVPCRLEPRWQGRENDAGTFGGATHTLAVPLGTDLRDGWPAGPWPVVAVPDAGGTAYAVVLVSVLNLGGPDAYRLAWLKRQPEPLRTPTG